MREAAHCCNACCGVDCLLHQAALGSALRSIENPTKTNDNNVTGMLNMLWRPEPAR